MIPVQRLTKYQLLIEKIYQFTEDETTREQISLIVILFLFAYFKNLFTINWANTFFALNFKERTSELISKLYKYKTKLHSSIQWHIRIDWEIRGHKWTHRRNNRIVKCVQNFRHQSATARLLFDVNTRAHSSRTAQAKRHVQIVGRALFSIHWYALDYAAKEE